MTTRIHDFTIIVFFTLIYYLETQYCFSVLKLKHKWSIHINKCKSHANNNCLADSLVIGRTHPCPHVLTLLLVLLTRIIDIIMHKCLAYDFPLMRVINRGKNF